MLSAGLCSRSGNGGRFAVSAAASSCVRESQRLCFVRGRQRRFFGVKSPLWSFRVGMSAIPHPKRLQSEDAFFVWGNADGTDTSSVVAVGVADGVGAWSVEKGINPALFSKSLMEGAKHCIQNLLKNDGCLNFSKSSELCSRFLLTAGWDHVRQSRIQGSSTACVLVLNGASGELNATNLGDSGFLIVRSSESLAGYDHRSPGCRNGKSASQTVLKSRQLIHYFNCPFQIGIDKDGNEDRFDNLDASEHYRFSLVSKDFIILATDGLFDNLKEEEILELLDHDINDENDVQSIAEKLAKAAYENSLNVSIDSPFAEMAKDNDILWSGGIKDDITVIVVHVK